MQLVEGWASLAERVGPTMLVPIGSALVITLLWWLTGWGWFDLGPWPWALGAIPIALLSVQRLVIAMHRHQRTTDAVGSLAGALDTLTHHLPDEHVKLGLAAVWLVRARFGREALHDLSEALEGDDLTAVRGAEDPLGELLERIADREPETRMVVGQVRTSIASVEIAAVMSPPSTIPSLALTTLFLATMPVGLVTTTGWWTVVAMAGVSLAYLAVEVVTESVERPLLGANAAPADAILGVTERALSRRSSRSSH